MTGSPIRIHSVAEAYLLLMVTPCALCGKGPLQASGHESVTLPGGSGRRLTARCQSCGHEQVFIFDLADVRDSNAEATRINPTQEPSRAVDLAQWLTLFEAIVRAADQQTEPSESRRLGYEAAQCLEEALKFYPEGDGEWPEESAFFYDWTLDRFRQHKHLFARTRLVDLRRKLPTLTRMEQRMAAPSVQGERLGTSPKPVKKPWWAFWRR